ncbi:hypothetical protein E2C01_073705 [Portunus trituberculatus]|uniref:Uncharacterized protein n=1 Tax=Portunus trituberculatus TaxID=210409 RepID=A0A5B7I1E8_PORTR|nr:hypothetical protein [Portunus trituberculatus]
MKIGSESDGRARQARRYGGVGDTAPCLSGIDSRGDCLARQRAQYQVVPPAAASLRETKRVPSTTITITTTTTTTTYSTKEQKTASDKTSSSLWILPTAHTPPRPVWTPVRPKFSQRTTDSRIHCVDANVRNVQEGRRGGRHAGNKPHGHRGAGDTGQRWRKGSGDGRGRRWSVVRLVIWRSGARLHYGGRSEGLTRSHQLARPYVKQPLTALPGPRKCCPADVRAGVDGWGRGGRGIGLRESCRITAG